MNRRKKYANEIVKMLKSGTVPQGLRCAIAVENQSKGEAIKAMVLEMYPDASKRELVIVPVGGKETRTSYFRGEK